MNLFKKYGDYIKDNPEGYWFKRKLFGWGWTPATWQGWLITGAYVFIVIMFALTIDGYSPPREVMFTFLLPVLIATALLIQICYRTGEKPKWQWGMPKKSAGTTNDTKDASCRNCNDGKGVSMGIAIGVSIGAALGAALNNLALGIALGISIGVAIGAGIDAQNKK